MQKGSEAELRVARQYSGFLPNRSEDSFVSLHDGEN